MKIRRRRFLHLAAGAATLSSAPRIAWAQTYPARPVRLIVAFAPGGVTDTFGAPHGPEARRASWTAVFCGEHYWRHWQHRHGPSSQGGARRLHFAIRFQFLCREPNSLQQIPYDPYKDFEPVTLAVTSTTVVTIHPSVPAKTVKDLIAVIRANPGKYSYASAGAGTQAHLAGEQFRLSLGLDLVHVPFNGGGPAIAAVVGGHTPIGFSSPAASIPQIKEGNVRALAITSKRARRFCRMFRP